MVKTQVLYYIHMDDNERRRLRAEEYKKIMDEERKRAYDTGERQEIKRQERERSLEGLGVWDTGEDPYEEDYTQRLEELWEQGDEAEQRIPTYNKREGQPKWQADFTDYDYYHFLLTAQRRVNGDEITKTLGNIEDRILAAQHQGMLPEEGAPTYIARDDFIDVPNSHLLGARIKALEGIPKKYGRKKGKGHALKYRNTVFEQREAGSILPEEGEASVFSVMTKFPDAIVRVRASQHGRFAVDVDFKKPRGEEEIPGYKSGFLPAERLTRDEVNVLAHGAIEVGFYNLYGDPEKSPYPWENQLPPSAPEPPTRFQ